MSNSLVFQIPTVAPASKSILKYQNQQNRLTAEKMAGIQVAKPYTEIVLNHVVDCCSRAGKVIPVKKYFYCIQTLEDQLRPRQQTDIENQIKSLSNRLICYSSTDVRRDSAALWAMSDLMDENPISISDEKALRYLMRCLNHCNVACQVVPASVKRALAGNAATDAQNETNLALAMAKLGCMDLKNKSVIATWNSLKAGTGIVPVDDIVDQLKAAGLKPDPVRAMLMLTLAKKSLGTRWPVATEWPEFPFGTGTGGSKAGLGADAVPPQPDAWDKAGSSLIGALPDILKAGTGLLAQYGSAKISEMQMDYQKQMLDLMQKQTGQSQSSITPDQMAMWAAQNQQASQAAAEAAAAKAGVDLKAAEDKNKMILYVGGGIAAFMMIGLIAVVAMKK